ncbi:MAG TPA: alpha-2-macroglobulin family protein [Pyrinomonadaceae bacterium]|jgi:hypothetical protein
MRSKTAVSNLLLLTMLLTHVAPPPTHAVTTRVGQESSEEEEDEPQGLRFRLSEAGAPKERAPQNRVEEGRPLPESETARLLARLPPLKEEEGDARGLNLRERGLPPPRAGQTIANAFAPPEPARTPPPSAASGALEVLRFAPEGEVELAPAVSLTFSQPMVAVASQEEAAATIPVKLSPRVAGEWRWLGTQTLVFRPEAEGGRLPAATVYAVEVPAGTKSAAGGALPRTLSYNFSTPPPTLKRTHPAGEGVARDAIIFLEFDQRIDAARVLEHVRLEPAALALRLRQATAEEVAADEQVRALVESSQPGRWLALRAVAPDGSTKEALPTETKVEIVVPPGAPSAEGPRVTKRRQGFSFKTYERLKVESAACGYGESCAPSDDFRLDFNNQLDAREFKPSQVTITPAIPDLKVTLDGDTVEIAGRKRGATIYTVTVARALRDDFGQTLGGANSFTFRVGREEPALFAEGDGFVVLDPARRRSFSVYTINRRRLKVSLYRVAPADWEQFISYEEQRRDASAGGEGRALKPPGTLVSERVVETRSTPDEVCETVIDLSPALGRVYGQVFVRVEPIEPRGAPVRAYAYGPSDGAVDAWVQATDIGLDAFADRDALYAWASSLGDGRSLSGVEVSAVPEGLSGVTGADGLARLRFGAGDKMGRPLLSARLGEDVAVLPPSYSEYGGAGREAWRREGDETRLAWYVFDDRGLYRPGEEVRVKGWVRKVGLTPRGDTEMFTPREGEALRYVVKDSRGNEVAKGAADLNALAGFDLTLKLPAAMNLGDTRVEFNLGGSSQLHFFKVLEFRRPEFEVEARASEAPHFVGGSATATVGASYYAGGGLPGAEVKWTVEARAVGYTPPGRADYTFGAWSPWWGVAPVSGATAPQQLKGRTDAEGRHALRIDFDSVDPPRPTSVTATAQVADVNRQALSAETTMLVHPSEVYVGLKTARTFVREGEPFDVRLVVTDIDGRAVAGRDVHLRLARLDYVQEEGEWVQKEADARELVVGSTGGEFGAVLPTGGGGVYQLKARVRDERGRVNESELTLWVAGGKTPPSRGVEQEKVELIPDRREYRAGDVAEILVRAPFAPAEGLLTLRRSGVLRTERFRVDGASHVLRVPLEEAWTPNVRVQVDLVGAAARVDEDGRERPSLPKRPAYASGELNVAVPAAARRLSVKATPRDAALEPGGETFVDVEVRDAQGRGVAGTDTAVVVVDESVLALADYKLADPLSAFYAEREAATDDFHLRGHVELASAEELEHRLSMTLGDRNLGAGAPGTGGGGAGGGGGGVDYSRAFKVVPRHVAEMAVSAPYMREVSPSVRVVTRSGVEPAEPELVLRRNFNALAVFAASLPTDASGRARVKVKLPDNLTRYRVTAVSVAGGRLAGSGESAVTARLPLMARPSAPRFLNFGDRAELPVVLQNQTERDAEVSVAVRATNAVLPSGAGRRLTVPAGDRVEVRFPVAAAKAGTARFQVAAVASGAGGGSDAAEFSLPVYTPATTEAFATYGVIDEGAAVQAVKAPAGAFGEFGGLEVQTSSTQLQELTDAFVYLYRYPFECGEQVASRVISVVALSDVLAAFGTKGLPAPSELRASIGADLERLRGLQNEDGGFGFWRRGEASVPFVSAHVAHALARARSKGFSVPDGMEARALGYLRQVGSKIPKEYGAESRRAIESYALYVRALMGERDAAGARRVIAASGGVEKLSVESLGWLLPVLSGDAASAKEAEAVRRHFNNRVVETAGAAHFADSYEDGAYTILHSDRRADGVVLDALIGDRPESDLIPKLVRGLLGGRRRGRWANTQENVFILLALERYFRTYERETPDFVARVWLGQSFAGEHAFKGRSPERRSLELPMSELVSRTATPGGAPVPLTIGKEGTGRLYFRVGATYAPSNLNVEAADYGFRVGRAYEAVDDPADVRRDAEGLWHVRAGARVRVRVRFFNPARRYHVALVDPLPAGLEALNPELATTGPLPRGAREEGVARYGRGVTDYYRYWLGTWYEHQNLRDERAEAFAALLWEGEHEFVYFARATTPGLFVVPPAKAEEMYAPETFGRGSTDRVVVE